HWPAWYGTYEANYPDMGSLVGDTYCNAFYTWAPQPPPYVSTWYPTYAGTPRVWASNTYVSSSTPIDYYVFGAKTQNKRKSDEWIPFIDAQLAGNLFSPEGLNIPLDPFVARTGPMKNVWLDETSNGFAGFPADQMCSYHKFQQLPNATPPSGATFTTLMAPSSAVLGENLLLQATVTSTSGIPSGSVVFHDGTTILGQATLDSTGSTTFTTNALSLGAHSLVAYYIVESPYGAS